jgi:hypothetical protein
MSADNDDSFAVSMHGDSFVCVRHKKEGCEHEFGISDGQLSKVCSITPARQLDPEQSLLDADRHSVAARAAAERFLRT